MSDNYEATSSLISYNKQAAVQDTSSSDLDNTLPALGMNTTVSGEFTCFDKLPGEIQSEVWKQHEILIIEERHAKISTALQKYRSTVLNHNIFLLRLLAEHVHNLQETGKISKHANFESMVEHIVHLPQSITSPQNLLNPLSDHVSTDLSHWYDGTDDRTVNLKLRDKWFAAVRKRFPRNIEITEWPPMDLGYLCTLVNGITNPQMPCGYGANMGDFISIIEEHDDIEKKAYEATLYSDDVAGEKESDAGGADDDDDEDDISDDSYDENEPGWKPAFILYDIWRDWKISVVFMIGNPREDIHCGGTFAVYCRRREDKEEWKWRYGMQDDGWCTDLYDSVEEFLGFWAKHYAMKEEDMREKMKHLEVRSGYRHVRRPGGM